MDSAKRRIEFLHHVAERNAKGIALFALAQLATYRRVGQNPFKDALYGAAAPTPAASA